MLLRNLKLLQKWEKHKHNLQRNDWRQKAKPSPKTASIVHQESLTCGQVTIIPFFNPTITNHPYMFTESYIDDYSQTLQHEKFRNLWDIISQGSKGEWNLHLSIETQSLNTQPNPCVLVTNLLLERHNLKTKHWYHLPISFNLYIPIMGYSKIYFSSMHKVLYFIQTWSFKATTFI